MHFDFQLPNEPVSTITNARFRLASDGIDVGPHANLLTDIVSDFGTTLLLGLLAACAHGMRRLHAPDA